MALIPRFFLDCVVAIGVPKEKEQARWVASGFLYGNFWKKDEKGENLYRVYLITNRHVLNGLNKVILRFNPGSGEQAKEYPLGLIDQASQKLRWTPHPNPEIDIAVIAINVKLLRE